MVRGDCMIDFYTLNEWSLQYINISVQKAQFEIVMTIVDHAVMM